MEAFVHCAHRVVFSGVYFGWEDFTLGASPIFVDLAVGELFRTIRNSKPTIINLKRLKPNAKVFPRNQWIKVRNARQVLIRQKQLCHVLRHFLFYICDLLIVSDSVEFFSCLWPQFIIADEGSFVEVVVVLVPVVEHVEVVGAVFLLVCTLF